MRIFFLHSIANSFPSEVEYSFFGEDGVIVDYEDGSAIILDFFNILLEDGTIFTSEDGSTFISE